MGDYEKIEGRIKTIINRLQGRDIAIYPYGKIGRLCRFVLEEEFNISPRYLVDNFLDEKNIISFETFYNESQEDKQDNIFIILAIADYKAVQEMLPELLCKGFDAKNIGVIFNEHVLSYKAIERTLCLSNRGDTLLDIGCGPGIQGRIFQDYGLSVTGITMADEGDYNGKCLSNVVVTDLMSYYPKEKKDIVWCSHMLEHFSDVNLALKKIRDDFIKPNGILSITVPAREHTVLLNHIHYFDAGRILRYLLFAGFDCREAEILEYGYNLSIIIPRCNLLPENLRFENEASHEPGDYHDGYGYDDMKQLYYKYLPEEIKIMTAWDGAPYFDGEIHKLNWKDNEMVLL